MARHISFGRFGERFLDSLLTPELIASQLRAAIPARIYIDETKPVPAEGRVTFLGIGEITRTVSADEVNMTVDLQLSLDVTLPTGKLPTVGVRLPLQVDFRTYDRLILFADAHFDRDAVTFDYKGWNPIDLGIIEIGLKWQFFLQAEAAIELSLPGRVIDVEAVLLEMPSRSLLDPADASGGTVFIGRHKSPLLPRDAVAGTTLGPGEQVAPFVLLREGERIQLSVYGASEHVPTAERPGALLGIEVRLHGSRAMLHTETVRLDEAWGGHWHLARVPAEGWFTAPKSGYYEVRVRNVATDATAHVKVRQVRQWAPGLVDDDRRISFADFGRNLVTLGLSAPFLEQQLAVLLAENLPGLRFPWADSPLGALEVSLRPGLREVAEVKGKDPDYTALRRITLKGSVRIARDGKRVASLPVDLGLLIALRTTDDPVAVEVGLESVSHVSVDGGPFRAITDTAVKLLGTVLSAPFFRIVEERLIDLVLLMLGRAGAVLQTERIADVAASMAATTPPIAIGPVPVFAGIRHEAQTLAGGQSRSHPVTLARTKPVAVVARFRADDAAGPWSAYCTLAVCDAQDGVLERKHVVLGPGAAHGKAKLRFRAPVDGEYHVRVRVHPQDEEHWRLVRYELDIKSAMKAALLQTVEAVPGLVRR